MNECNGELSMEEIAGLQKKARAEPKRVRELFAPHQERLSANWYFLHAWGASLIDAGSILSDTSLVEEGPTLPGQETFQGRISYRDFREAVFETMRLVKAAVIYLIAALYTSEQDKQEKNSEGNSYAEEENIRQ